MKKWLIVGGEAAFLIILIFLGIYFFTRGNKSDDLITKKNKLQSDLVLAQDKLNKERENLYNMTGSLKQSYSLAFSVQDEMKKASDMVSQTDFMFIDPYGLGPQLRVKNTTDIIISLERKDINLLIFQWQKKTDLLSVSKIDVNESEKIRNEAAMIKKYIQDLSEIVGGLTPANSGLSQLQINTYLAQLPSVDVINQVLASIGTAIENAISNNNSQALNTQTQTETNTGANVGTQNDQTPPSFGSNTRAVTPEAVVAEQAVVAETQTTVTTLQEQLAQIEEQIQQSSPPPVETTTTINPVPENQNTNNGENTNGTENLPSRDIINGQGIIIQPGPPRLIQGTDPF